MNVISIHLDVEMVTAVILLDHLHAFAHRVIVSMA